MCLVAWGDIGLGALICETDSGRPLATSTESDTRCLEERLSLSLEECLELLCAEEEEDLCDDDL
jgi:hypothetical protein